MYDDTNDGDSCRCPAILFHYTSIETLTLILSAKTIRFNRLDRVNDLEEALSSDLPNAQTFVFASCWTATEADEVALWKLYTAFRGIRIELPVNMFAGRNKPKRSAGPLLHIPIEDLDKDGALRLITVDHTDRHHLLSHVYGPSAIEYSNDYNFLKIQCLSSDGTVRKHSIKDLGSRKHTNWRFENEYRFRIFADFPEGQEGDFTFLSPEEAREVVTEFVDVPLDQYALNEAQIMLGPKTTDAHRLMVESLCARYAPKIDISKSVIRIRS